MAPPLAEPLLPPAASAGDGRRRRALTLGLLGLLAGAGFGVVCVRVLGGAEERADELLMPAMPQTAVQKPSMLVPVVPGMLSVPSPAAPPAARQRLGAVGGAFGSGAGLPAQVVGPARNGLRGWYRNGMVARAMTKGQQFVVRQPKPLGIDFDEKPDGIYVKRVNRQADDRVKAGDKLLAVSASFGGEIWPAKSYQQTMSAIRTRAGPVYLKFQSGGGGGNIFGRKGQAAPMEFDEAGFEDTGNAGIGQVATIVVGLLGLAFLAVIGSNV